MCFYSIPVGTMTYFVPSFLVLISKMAGWPNYLLLFEAFEALLPKKCLEFGAMPLSVRSLLWPGSRSSMSAAENDMIKILRQQLLLFQQALACVA